MVAICAENTDQEIIVAIDERVVLEDFVCPAFQARSQGELILQACISK